MKQLILFISLLIYCSCSKSETIGELPNPPEEKVDGVRIEWDNSSMQKLDDRGGYPRMVLLADKSLMVIYETYTGNIAFKKSSDEGKTWSERTEVFSKFNYSNDNGESVTINMSNPEVIQLQNGDIIIGCNYRPAKEEIAPYSVVIRRSQDNGVTWSEPQILYNAAPRFRDGCWEPAFLQLPNGELQVYFANENPYRQSDEQEISMLTSTDNGATWTKTPKTVSFRQGRRDGMPVPQIIGDDFVVVIEDNKTDQFKPYTVRTKVADNWSDPILADSPNRKYALEKQVPDNVYMGAPYLVQLPSGETIISYQTNENRSSNWELSTMEVAIGDENACNFRNPTRPFSVPLDKEAKWNALVVVSSNTIVALTSSNFDGGHVAPWMIKGRVVFE